MKKSEGLERFSLLLIGVAIGVVVGAIALTYLSPLVGFFAPLVIMMASFLIRLWSDKEAAKEKFSFRINDTMRSKKGNKNAHQ